MDEIKECAAFKARMGAKAGNIGYTVNGSPTLTAEMETHVVIALEGNGARPSHRGGGFSTDGRMFTLNTVDRHSVCYPVNDCDFHICCFRKSCKPGADKTGEKWIEDTVTNTLNTFENTDVRTTEVIVMLRNQNEGISESHGLVMCE